MGEVFACWNGDGVFKREDLTQSIRIMLANLPVAAVVTAPYEASSASPEEHQVSKSTTEIVSLGTPSMGCVLQMLH